MWPRSWVEVRLETQLAPIVLEMSARGSEQPRGLPTVSQQVLAGTSIRISVQLRAGGMTFSGSHIDDDLSFVGATLIYRSWGLFDVT